MFVVVFSVGKWLDLPRPIVLILALIALVVTFAVLILIGALDAALSVYPNSGRSIP